MRGRRLEAFDPVYLILVLAIVISTITLLLSLFPPLWHSLLLALDVRRWSRLTWLVVNLAALAVLLGIRLAPDVRQALESRRAEAAKRKQRDERKRQAAERKERLSRRIGR